MKAIQYRKLAVLCACLLLFLWASAFAQEPSGETAQNKQSDKTYNITGYVRDAETGEPLPYANVYLKDAQYGAATNVHGYFVITGIPNGAYTIVISMIGFAQVEKRIQLQPKGETRFDFEVAPQAIETGAVEVTADKLRFEKDVEISRTNLSFREIRSTPAFVEADVFRTVQQLPSVTSQNDLSSALIVRGGSPDENLIMVDGAEIYNPFHLGGLFSTFNADAIADAEFMAGGYPAEYPGRLSSVLSITSKEGNSKQGKLFKNKKFGKYWDISGVQAAVSMLSSKALAEGPFYKGAWILSGRRTYFDLMADLVGEGRDWDYYFWDNQFKIFSDLNKQNRVTFSTFNGKDVLNFFFEDEDLNDEIDFDWNWGNNSASLQWRFIPGSKFLSEFTLTRSSFNFDVNLNVTDIDTVTGRRSDVNFAVVNKINDISATEKLTWFVTPRHTLTTGATLKNLTMEFNLDIDRVNFFDVEDKPDVYSGFIQDKWEITNRLTVQLGLHGAKYELHDDVYLDPRFGFKYLLNNSLSLKGSWGRFSQFLFTINDENEILRIVDFWQPVPEEFEAIRNQHFIGGVEKWFEQGFTGSFEAYYKPYSNVLTGNPNNNPGIDDDEFISGDGRVWGVELLLKKTTGKWKGWVGYSYSDIERRFDYNGDGVIEKTDNEFSEIYAPIYSKPHSFNLAVNYQITPKNQLSMSWTLSSGQPYTPVVGKVYHGGGNPNDPYSGLININGRRHSSRFPMYLRGDVAWVRDVSLFGLGGKFNVQVMNITNQFNTLLYLWDHDESPSKVQAISMFPILPSIGFEFKL